MGIEVVFQALSNFFDDYFLAIFLATIIFFIILLITWWTYRTLSKRNVFHLYRHADSTSTSNMLLYILKYFFLFPIYTFMGFVIFSFSLFILMQPQTFETQTKILFIAIVMISTIRISAYVHESMAEDLAKLIPLTLFSILLTHPSLDQFTLNAERLSGFFSIIPAFSKYLVFTILLEAVLRGGTWLFRNVNREEQTA